MKVLIVDDHAVVRWGVERLLAAVPGAVVHEAATVSEARALFRSLAPDVIVLDINLDDASGLDLLKWFRLADRQARIVMFSMHADPNYASRALRAGALGYVSKTAAADELAAAVEAAATGARYIDRDTAADLALTRADGDDPLKSLSNREIEILRLLGQGRSMTDIARALGIAYKTVANLCVQIKDKLGLGRTVDLIRYAIEKWG